MREAYVPQDLVRELLRSAGDLILVGGQALAYWMDRYGVRVDLDDSTPAISHDVDFLAESPLAGDDVRRLASVLGGDARVYPPEAITALIGQAYRQIESGEFLNVDVLHKIYGSDHKQVAAAAVEVVADGVRFRVMNPMHVLKSRLDNLHGLREKQTVLGQTQLAAAIEVAQCAQRELHATAPSDGASRSPTLPWVRFIQGLARSSAGRKVAERHGIFVADAIEPQLVDDPGFKAKHLPALRELMSDQRVKDLGL